MIQIKIIEENPPFLKAILNAGLKPEKTTIFPFGFLIYNPSGLPIPDDIMVHETVHMARQGRDPKNWWVKYLKDKEFRLNEELEANRKQYKFICKLTKDREQRSKALMAMAKNISGEVYGKIVSFSKAYEMIKT